MYVTMPSVFWVLAVCLSFTSFATTTLTYGAHYETYDVMADAGSAPGGSAGSWDLLNGRLSRPKCVEIPANLTLCQGLEYNQMRLPNLLEHDTLREVSQQSSSWKPLLGLRCHADTQLFLCSLFAPVCLSKLEAAVWPCRSLCQAVQAGCEGPMLRYGFPWPEMLRCDKFPVDNDLCIGVLTASDDTSVCNACTQAYTFEGIGDNYCSADFVMKVRIRSTKATASGELQLILRRKRKIYKAENVPRRQVREATVFLEHGTTCNCTHLALEDVGTQHFLLMGSMRNGKWYVSFIHPYERSRGLRDAMKAMRAGSICEGGVQVLAAANNEESEAAEAEDNQAVAPAVRPEQNVPRTPAKSRADGSRRNRNEDRLPASESNNRATSGGNRNNQEQRRNNRNNRGGNRRDGGASGNRRSGGSTSNRRRAKGGRRKNRNMLVEN